MWVGVEGYVFHAPYPVEGGQSLLLLLTSLAQKRGCKERGWPLLAGCLGSASAAWRPAPDESTGIPHGGTPQAELCSSDFYPLHLSLETQLDPDPSRGAAGVGVGVGAGVGVVLQRSSDGAKGEAERTAVPGLGPPLGNSSVPVGSPNSGAGRQP